MFSIGSINIFFISTALPSIVFGCASLSSLSSSQPILSAWLKCNGTGYGNIINNVKKIQASTNFVYTYAASIPQYNIGPWPGNPNTPKDQKFLFKFPRYPKSDPNMRMRTPLGHIGQWINGVTVYNALDAMSYMNMGIWNQNAYYFESVSFDGCNGHPDQNGEYHHHCNPKCLQDNATTIHSKILGFAFDGYPIYGPYGYSNPNDTNSAITRMRTSYIIRNITTRDSLANGTALTGTQVGPTINATYPLGAYVEDFEFVRGSGDLDEFNGRVCVTPDYPNSTYAYFVTIDANGVPVYPFVIGPSYYGLPEPFNFGPNMGKTANESLTDHFICNAATPLYKFGHLNALLIVVLAFFHFNI